MIKRLAALVLLVSAAACADTTVQPSIDADGSVPAQNDGTSEPRPCPSYCG